MKYLYYRSCRLDEIDLRIVGALFENARTPMVELARSVKLSAPSVIERVRRLEDAGVIVSYRACINTRALGLEVSAYIRIRPMPGLLAKVSEILAGLKEIVECDRITGEDCFIARIQVPSVRAIQEVIDRLVPYATTNTSIIQSTPVTCRLPAIPTTKVTRKAKTVNADLRPEPMKPRH